MKKILALSIAALFASASFATYAVESTCDAVKADITQKIINNGVPESAFELSLVPEAQAEQAEGKIVGSCDNGTQRVIYLRHANVDSAGTATHQASETPKVEDTEHPELQPQPVQ